MFKLGDYPSCCGATVLSIKEFTKAYKNYFKNYNILLNPLDGSDKTQLLEKLKKWVGSGGVSTYVNGGTTWDKYGRSVVFISLNSPEEIKEFEPTVLLAGFTKDTTRTDCAIYHFNTNRAVQKKLSKPKPAPNPLARAMFNQAHSRNERGQFV